MALIDGDQAILDDPFPYTIYNELKNHWRGADAPAGIVAGMIFNDSDDEKLYQYDGSDLLEIIKENDAGDVPIFENVETGDTPAVYIYGFEVGDAVKYLKMSVDTDGQALIEAEKDIHLISGSGEFQIISPGDSLLHFYEVGDSRAIISYDTANKRISIHAVGEDADIYLDPNGTGRVRFGTHAALAGDTVTGKIAIKDSAGNARLLAVVS